MDGILKDLSVAARRLRRNPGFTLAAVLALALGIGATSGIYSLLRGVALRPLPYEEADRMVQLWAAAPERGLDRTEVSFTKFERLVSSSRALAHVAAFRNEYFNLSDEEEPIHLQGARISHQFFDVWRVEPIRGRRFSPSEDRLGGPDVVLLSHGLWQRRYGSDPAVVGQTVRLDGRPFTIVGVMPPELRFPFRDTDLWVPRVQESDFLSRQVIEEGAGFLNLTARLAPGVDLERTREDMDRISRTYREESPHRLDAPFGLSVIPLEEALVGKVREALWLLLGAVAFVLLIACANVANLLLAQGVARREEAALRIALGAHPRSVVRQFVVEGTLLALLGGAVGLAAAYVGLELLVASNAGDLPRLGEVEIDGAVLVFTLLVSFVSAGLFSLMPALRTSRSDPRDALGSGARGATGGPKRGRLQDLFVVAEVALALILLAGAGLLIETLRGLQAVDPGFDPDDVLVMRLNLPKERYPGMAERMVFLEEILERTRAVPGVQSVALADFLPIRGAARTPVRVEGQEAFRPEEVPMAFRMVTSPGYFRTLRTEILEGRGFDPDATREGPLEAVVNESFRRLHFAGRDAVGSYLLLGPEDPLRVEIVGVVDDVKPQGLDEVVAPQFYLSSRQVRDEMTPAPFMHLLARTELPAESLVRTVRREVQAVDRDQAVADPETMSEIIDMTLEQRRFTALLFGGFSLAALLLALLGIYGVVSHAVSLRRREIGIRMALGAQPRDVLRSVARRNVILVTAGLALGLGGALAVGRLLRSQLFQVGPADPAVLAGVTALLAVVAMIACWLPSQRATRIDPVTVLRQE